MNWICHLTRTQEDWLNWPENERVFARCETGFGRIRPDQFKRKCCAIAAAVAAMLAACNLAAQAQNIIAWGDNSYGQTNVPVSATNVLAIAAGDNHSLALKDDGTVVAWGDNSSGQTDVPPSVANAVAIAAGFNHSLALREDGTVVAWGSNSSGQTNVPVSVTNVVAIAARSNYCFALRANGTVISWGGFIFGTTLPRDYVAIAAGASHSLGLRTDGSVAAWANGPWGQMWGQTQVPASATNVVAIAAGENHSLALRVDGTVIAWGQNSSGQRNVPPTATNAVAASAASDYSFVLRADGTVVQWGHGQSQLLPLTNVTAIAAGRNHTLALLGNGAPTILALTRSTTVIAGSSLSLFVRAMGDQPLTYSWLSNGVPILDVNTNYPSISVGLGSDSVNYQAIVSNAVGCVTSAVVNVTVRSIGAWGDNVDGQCNIPLTVTNTGAISAGAFHSLALNADGSIVAWGKNWDGQTDVPQEATNVVAVAAGGDHSLALREDCSVIAWGRNWDGQTNVPPWATNVVAISAGWAHSLALRADGTVVAWGNDTYGQTEVSFLATEVIAIAAGYYHNLALKSDGTVVGWGLNSTVPPTATNVVAIAAGAEHSLALRADGSVIAWGSNTFSQATVPGTATNVVAIAAGFYHSLARRADGTVIAWGKGYFGVTNVVAGLRNVASIAAGEDHSVATVESDLPRFNRSLTSVVAHAGSQTIFSPGFVGTYPLDFQWYHEGIAIEDATNGYLLLANAQLSDAGTYVLVVSNAFGQTTNAPVNLTVRSDPVTTTAVGAWGDNVHGQCNVPPALMNPRAIAAGPFHALCLQEDGTVLAWGRTIYGSTNIQFGLPYGTTPLDQTNVPPAATNVMAVAAGRDHSLALRSDGQVIAWGGNSERQTTVPASATNVVAIAAGSLHSVSLQADGSVLAWGNNDERQTNVPIFLKDVIAVAAGYYHNLAIRSDHSVVAWGSVYQVPPSATNVVAVAGGWEHSLALRADGSVIAWGDNSYGQSTVPETATNVIALAAGYGFSLGLLADGSVIAWGKTNFAVTTVPASLRNVAAIAAGEDYCVAMVELGPPRFGRSPAPIVAHVGGQAYLTAGVQGTRPFAGQWFHDGTAVPGATDPRLLLASVQTNDAGIYLFATTNAIGQVTSTPTSMSVLSAPSIATVPAQQNVLVGRALGLAVTAVGAQPLTYQWRLNDADLADGGRISGARSPVLSFNTAEYGDAGDYSVLVGNAFGSATGLVAQLSVTPILAWGDNSAGQLLVPREATNVVAIASGGDHNLALRADGTVVAWGDNFYGQCTVPASASNVIAIAAGGSHSLAALASGAVIAWGDNTYGQTNAPSVADVVVIAGGGAHSLAVRTNGSGTGWGSPLAQPLPFPLSGIAAIAAGGLHNLAVSADGSVRAWGNNWCGQTNVPSVTIPVIAVAAGDHCSLVLRADGTIVGWGYSASGQTTAPVSATNVVAIAAGDDHGVALRADGRVIAWGDNSFGQTNVPSEVSAVAVAAGSAHSLALVTLAQQCDRAITLGGNSLLSAASLGRGRANYQWQFNGMNIPGATNLSFPLGSVHWTNAGSYRVVASNALGSVTGPVMTLTVLRTPLRFDRPTLHQDATNTSLLVRLLGASGVGPVVVYASSNLLAWEPVFTNPPVIGSLEFIDSAIVTSGKQFYRAAEIVLPGPLRFETVSPSLQAGIGAFPLRLTGLTALGPVTIYASSNLLDWEAIFTNPPTIGPLEYWDWPASGQSWRFYRAAEAR